MATQDTRPAALFNERAGEAWALLQDRTDAQLDVFGRATMARLSLARGARVLDVGCGCGQTLGELAELVGPSGYVLGVDVSEPMLARAQRFAAAHSTIELVRADAQTYAFVPASFDAMFSRFGVMFFEDPRAAFTNLRRALRPQGRLAFVCWQAMSRNPWAERPLQAVLEVLGGEPPPMLRPGVPGPFAFADAELVRAILADAGFVEIAVESFETPLHFGGAMTIAEAVAYATQIGPAARAMTDAPAAQRPALEAALAGALAPFASDRGVWVDSAAFIVTARA
jgi:SAM-dependent methyltransferase